MKKLLILGLLGLFSSSIFSQNCAQTSFPDPPTNLNANNCIGWDMGPNGEPGNWLTWTPPAGATACIVAGNVDTNPNDFILWVGDINAGPAPSSIFVPIQNFPGSVYDLFRFKVICGCSVNPLNASPFSAYHYFGQTVCDP